MNDQYNGWNSVRVGRNGDLAVRPIDVEILRGKMVRVEWRITHWAVYE